MESAKICALLVRPISNPIMGNSGHHNGHFDLGFYLIKGLFLYFSMKSAKKSFCLLGGKTEFEF